MSASDQSAQGSVPKVSVVIPAYNYAAFLPKAIDSVLSQQFTDYEIIVVDDGSTDSTAQVVAQYGARVRYIHQKNAGLPAARNTGIKAARGEFVGFLDADDQWLPTFLKQAVETFARLSPDFAIVAFRPIYVDQNGNQLGLKRIVAERDEEITCADIIFKTRFPPSAVVARRAALDACGGFNPVLRSSEDRDMWIRMATRYRVFLHHERLMLFRRHSGSMSKHADRMKENIRKVLLNSYQNNFVPRDRWFFWMRVWSFYYFQTAWMYYEEGRRSAAVRDMLQSVFLWPCFLHPKPLNEPVLFRARSLLRFSLLGTEAARKAAMFAFLP